MSLSDTQIALLRPVAYEVWMLDGTAERLGRSAAEPAGRVVHNALVESFAMHARQLIHFFYPRNLHPTDVLARHFLDGREWSEIAGRPSGILARIHDAASREVAHITERRQHELKKTSWKVSEIHRELSVHVRRFCEMTAWQGYLPLGGPEAVAYRETTTGTSSPFECNSMTPLGYYYASRPKA